MTGTDARDLVRTADALADCAHRLEQATRPDPPPPEIERLARTMRRMADDLASHATTIRRLDDQIELATRRRDDGRELAELVRRRTRVTDGLKHAVDDATRTLIPGGDVLDPTVILRRLSGPSAPATRAYFGRPPVDRAERVRRLTSFLRRGTPHPVSLFAPPTTSVITVPSRSSRLDRIRRRLLTRTPHHPTTGGAA